jgi:16S rRNA (cytosine1402-N4)-methyltransferase
LTSTAIRKSNGFHRPVLVEEVARFLVIRRDGVYADLTSGGGGHLSYISQLLSKAAVLVGVDRDPEAVEATKRNLASAPQKVKVVNSTFARLDDVFREIGIKQADSILMDLGISSHQIDTPGRGFSFMQDGPLDMRMGLGCRLTAGEVINNYSQRQLTVIFEKYGEEKLARRAAKAVCLGRKGQRIKTTGRLREVLEPALPARNFIACLARLFQAVRIEVNDEISQLKETLPKALQYLTVGGRLVVISYHSLEDRTVKRFLAEKAKGCICPDDFPVCVCGQKPSVKILTRRVVKPSPEEIEYNPRARSAKLRAGERIA